MRAELMLMGVVHVGRVRVAMAHRRMIMRM